MLPFTGQFRNVYYVFLYFIHIQNSVIISWDPSIVCIHLLFSKINAIQIHFYICLLKYLSLTYLAKYSPKFFYRCSILHGVSSGSFLRGVAAGFLGHSQPTHCLYSGWVFLIHTEQYKKRFEAETHTRNSHTDMGTCRDLMGDLPAYFASTHSYTETGWSVSELLRWKQPLPRDS